MFTPIALYTSFGASLKVDPARPQRIRPRALVGFQKALSSARPKTGHGQKARFDGASRSMCSSTRPTWAISFASCPARPDRH